MLLESKLKLNQVNIIKTNLLSKILKSFVSFDNSLHVKELIGMLEPFQEPCTRVYEWFPHFRKEAAEMLQALQKASQIISEIRHNTIIILKALYCVYAKNEKIYFYWIRSLSVILLYEPHFLPNTYSMNNLTYQNTLKDVVHLTSVFSNQMCQIETQLQSYAPGRLGCKSTCAHFLGSYII